jgi:hypothetical protein
MALPEPRPGLVFRYDYLWSRDSMSGSDQGKERPACLVAATDPAIKPRFVVIVPITHSPPSGDTVGIEIPPRVRQAIGLDDAPCWFIVSEHNVDEWPNSGLAPVPGRPGVFSYGFIPPSLFAQIRGRFLALVKQGQGTSVRR